MLKSSDPQYIIAQVNHLLAFIAKTRVRITVGQVSSLLR